MFERFARSWQLTKSAWGVIRSDKELLGFPLLSAVLTAVATLLFSLLLIVGAVTIPGLGAALQNNGGEGEGRNIVSIIVLFIYYLISSFIVTYFASGLTGAALIRLRGGDPTFRDGMRIAAQHTGSIFVYAVMAAVVGVVASLLRGQGNRGGVGRNLAASATTAAWSIASFLAVPILVSTEMGPFQALAESTRLLKKTWGEQLIGSGGIGFVFGLGIFVVIIASAFLAFVLVDNNLGTAALVVVVLAILIVALLAVLQSALNAIYKAAVYLYAAEEKPSPAFSPALVQTAFQPAR